MNLAHVNAITRTALLSLALAGGAPSGAQGQGQGQAQGQGQGQEADLPESQPDATRENAGPYTFGVRIGGYAFRDVAADGRSRWRDCRMDGIGVFGERSFGDYFYLEGGADYYFARDGRGMNRRSALLSLVASGRMFPDFLLTPYVQVGLGIEVTRVDLQGHGSDARALPLGFVGLGIDINAGEHLRLGANARAHMMGHFPHGHDAPSDDHRDGVPDAEMELSAQAQFYVKYRI